jgi:hypothetical protein
MLALTAKATTAKSDTLILVQYILPSKVKDLKPRRTDLSRTTEEFRSLFATTDNLPRIDGNTTGFWVKI